MSHNLLEVKSTILLFFHLQFEAHRAYQLNEKAPQSYNSYLWGGCLFEKKKPVLVILKERVHLWMSLAVTLSSDQKISIFAS